jgi:hypothetical protein
MEKPWRQFLHSASMNRYIAQLTNIVLLYLYLFSLLLTADIYNNVRGLMSRVCRLTMK